MKLNHFTDFSMRVLMYLNQNQSLKSSKTFIEKIKLIVTNR